jgi:uncharacterized caspase-like protein
MMFAERKPDRALARWSWLVVPLLQVFATSHALAENRVALVIGNSAYKHAPALANPKNDAEGMAASLKRLGFEVLAGTDLDKPSMDKLLQAFADKLEKADVALVFYAGHGLQVNGRNYLVPTDGKLDKESDLVFQATALDTIQGLMEQGQRTSIMILDACRDNPLARNLARSMGTRSSGIGRGLGAAQAGVGTLIVYATQPGNVALDGDVGANSPFTAALLAHLETKGLEVRQVLTRVRQAVIEKTKGKQVPWDSSSLTGDFFFVASAREAPPAETKPPAATPPATSETPRSPSADSENLFWQSIKDSKNAADFRAYLERYPNGTFAALAKIRIAEIEKAADVTPPKPAPEKPAPPPRPQRTSTWEPGIAVTGDRLRANTTENAQACRELCLANAQCVAWRWYPGYCIQVRKVSHRYNDSYSTSGVIRPVPAAAPGQPAAPVPSTRPPALGDPVQELIRKVRAGELESGFCARVTWPRLSTSEITARYNALPANSGYVAFRNANIGGCGVVRVGPLSTEAAGTCRTFENHDCFADGLKCRSLGPTKLCHSGDFNWKPPRSR